MLITTSETFLMHVMTGLHDAQTIVVDLETTGLAPYLGDRLTGVALYLPEFDESYYVSFRHGEGDNLDLKYLDMLKEALSDPSKTYYGWNVKFDIHFLLVDGFPILERRAIYRDVMLALHTLDENRFDLGDKRGLNYKLKDNARLYLGNEAASADDELDAELKRRNLGKGEMWRLSGDTVAPYAEDDVRLTWRLYQFFLPYLEKWDQVEYFNGIAEFNALVLPRMEQHGVPVDRDLIQQHILDNRKATDKAFTQLKQKYGEKFNPNSSQQVSAALGTSNSKRTTLERQGSEQANDILIYKNLSKAEGTFYNPYLHYSSVDGRIHATFNIGRTTSRRLSSSEPNLQQVPRYSSRYRVKEVFTALPGYKFVEIDYSQQELRLACHFSGQENMTQAYVNGEDVHVLTAAHLFMVEIDQVTKEQRQIGKTANFGFSYGMGVMKSAVYIASSLSKALSIDYKFWSTHKEYLPRVEAVAKLNENNQWVDEDGNVVQSQIYQRYMKWKEFTKALVRMYAGVMVVEDAKAEERTAPDDVISIYSTANILFSWKALYPNFGDSLKRYANEANTLRHPDGTLAFDTEGYRFLRLEDGCIRHYIKGQRPFTGWNYKIQGTGASIMRQSLMRIDKQFPYGTDEVIPVLSVHDSVVLFIKDNENFATNIQTIRDLMTDYDYYPRMEVDVKVGTDWGHLEDYAA